MGVGGSDGSSDDASGSAWAGAELAVESAGYYVSYEGSGSGAVESGSGSVPESWAGESDGDYGG